LPAPCPLGPLWRDHGLIFTRAGGEPLRGHHVTERMYKPLLKRLQLPMLSFHDLRHTAATLLLKAGVPVKVVSEMLGHASVAFTLQTYAHVLPICNWTLPPQRSGSLATTRWARSYAPCKGERCSDRSWSCIASSAYHA
jgi:hypothetical protein